MLHNLSLRTILYDAVLHLGNKYDLIWFDNNDRHLGRRITKHTDDHRESAFLFQRISTLIQRFNAVAVLGTFAPTTTEEDV